MKLTVKDLMTSRQVSVKSEEPIREAVMRMAGGGGLVAYVVDNSAKLIGLITPRRILKQSLVSEFGASRYPSIEWVDLLSSMTSKTVGDIMGPPIATKPEDSIEDAIEIMLDKNLYELPVIDTNSRLVGEIRVSSILSYWAEHLKASQEE